MGLFSKLKRSNTLYFPGCIAYFKEKDNFQLWKDIFSRLGIDFKITDKKICCGLPALEAGYESEARKLARRNFEIFKEEKINKIITTCPVCYKMFTQDYKRYLPDWNIEIINIWELILNKIEEKPGLIKNKEEKASSLSSDNEGKRASSLSSDNEGKRASSLSSDNEGQEIGFQDSCYLGRYCGIYNEPRKILGLIGYKIKEFKDNKESSFCSGSCGGLPRTNPLLADKAAKEKLLQAKRIGIKKLVVCSLEEYNLLKKTSNFLLEKESGERKDEEKGIEILEFTDVLGYALGIKKKDVDNNKEKVSSDSSESESKASSDKPSSDSEESENSKIAEVEVE